MVVTSGLPLLMIKGKLTSLEIMSVEDLETFIPFMTQCSVQRASAATVNDTPVWWVGSVGFRFPLQRPTSLSLTGYRRCLVSIVCRCYYYHDQQYILQLCTQLARSPESIVMKANDNNTTSLYYSKSLLHILTFNNQNKDYDKIKLSIKKETCRSPRRCLLPTKRNKPITDVYLCENCDAEFNSQAGIVAHERQCYGKPESLPPAPQSTPADLLGYLQLGNGPPSTEPKPSPIHLSLSKNRRVEFSSLLGRRMLEGGVAKRDLVTNPEKLIQFYEACCFISQRPSKLREMYGLRISYRHSPPQQSSRCRRYCFTRAERIERYHTLRTGLSKHSRLLLSQCKRCSVAVTRWTPQKPSLLHSLSVITVEDIDGKQPGLSMTSAATMPQVVDLCSSDDE